MPGTVGEELIDLVKGTHAKGRWLRGAMLASGFFAALLADLLGFREYRTFIALGLVATWFIVAVAMAVKASRTE
jgi:hypothetical protein